MIEQIRNQICDSVCEGFQVRPIPIGYSIQSPIPWISGDNIPIYLRIDGDRARLEDSGSSIFDLEGQGVDLKSDNRRQILSSLLQTHNVNLDDDSTFVTNWAELNRVTKDLPQFLSFLTRVQDLIFLSRDKVQSAFREDLKTAVEKRFGQTAIIKINEPVSDSLSNYPVDLLIEDRSNETTSAIFAAVSDVNVLQAVLFSKEVLLKEITGVKSFLIYEEMDSPRITSRSRAIATNSELIQADWATSRQDTIEKIWRNAISPPKFS
jgi:hypothetical protein